jgi:hypothetical protein|tara:strand:+ start:474 stop:1238 length:765 start_codon:yes stop_codon:yes gene_type:complete
MAHCNLISHDTLGKAKRGQDKTAEFAKLAGINLIELHHHLGIRDDSIRVKGFQGGEVIVIEKNGRKNFEFLPTKQQNGTDVDHGNGLVFIPEETTSQLKAWCPDTEYNRNFMAYFAFRHKKAFYIADKQIEKEIEDLAVEKGYNNIEVVNEAEIIQKQADDLVKSQEETIKYKEMYENAIKAQALTNKVASEEKELFEKCKNEVHEIESEWIEKEYKKYGKGKKDCTMEKFQGSMKYKDYILPKIKVMVAEKKG